MKKTKQKLIDSLSKTDQRFIENMVDLILQKDQYTNLRNELHLRRKEIHNNEVLSHDDVWK